MIFTVFIFLDFVHRQVAAEGYGLFVDDERRHLQHLVLQCLRDVVNELHLQIQPQFVDCDPGVVVHLAA